jgi:glycine cleavage system H protein
VLGRDRAYDPDTHVWVKREPGGRVRLGLDPLGIETMGSLAHVDIVPVGTAIVRSEPVGTLEAEKFVGPLECPVSGTVVAVNAAAVADPRTVHADPLATWLLELDPADYEYEAAALVAGDDIAAWFADEVADHRRRGVLAE